ncbi:MAG: hypothetical protein LBB40_06140 [Holophagales bacterium]|jgi:hypothetical protein|nr:hypothetical protein [Holophagales bacterium]
MATFNWWSIISIKNIICFIFLSVQVNFLTGQDISSISQIAALENSTALIVITDAVEDAINAMKPLLSGPSLLPYKINLSVINRNIATAPELRTLETWQNRQKGWAFIGPDGKFAMVGDGLPDLGTLEAILRETGAVAPLTELKKYYRQNTNRIDVMLLMLEELVRIGDTTTSNIIGYDPTAEQSLNTDALLTEIQDDDIWSEYARLFRTNISAIIDVTYQDIAYGSKLEIRNRYSFTSNILPSSFSLSHSPNLMALSRAVLPQIESELINSPYNSFLWWFWTMFRPNRGGMEIGGFIDLIIQNSFREQKPIVNATIIEVMRKEKQWKKLIEVLEPVWRDLVEENTLKQSQNNLSTNMMVGGVFIEGGNPSENDSFTQLQWSHNIFPLFAAYVESDSIKKTEDIIKTWIKEKGWSRAVDQAKDYVLKHYGELPSQNWPN